MRNDKYITRNDGSVLFKDNTDYYAPKFYQILVKSATVKKMNFSSPVGKHKRFDTNDYKLIGYQIFLKKMKIWDQVESGAMKGAMMYVSHNTKRYPYSDILVSRTALISPGIVIHEATHAIQDYRRETMRTWEVELEAQFACQLARIAQRKSPDKLDPLWRIYIYEIAQEYLASGESFYRKPKFRRLRRKAIDSIDTKLHGDPKRKRIFDGLKLR